MRSLLFLTMALMMLNACGGKSSDASKSCAAETDGREFSGIINGKSLQADGPLSSRVVLLVFKTDEGTEECTGSILPKNVILTAGHCVPFAASKIRVVFTAMATEDCPVASANIRKVSKIISHPQYINHNASYDIALLKFVGDMPTNFASFEVPDDSTSIFPSENLIMLGYGKNAESDNSGSAVLRITSNSASQLESGFENSLTYVVAQPTNGICNGDSGSPLVVMRGSVPKIIGVTSKVAGDNEENICHGSSQFVRTDLKTQWIRETYSKLTR
jgi:secreted trypsin-like serine protease